MRPDPIFAAFLVRSGLAASAAEIAFAPLPGGVSSDIWRAETSRGVYCLKRALAKLKVAQDWFAPVERNAYEVAWLEAAGALVPGAVPRVLAHEPAHGLFAMEFLDPASYRPWKQVLREGEAVPAFAAHVAGALAAIHAGTASDPAVAARFATDDIFYDIRLDPYLVATGRAHNDLAGLLARLAQETAANRRVLVHGDVSPKNILVGPAGPVFLDAECAWYGDPAFDVAFCLNHLLLKCLWTPAAAEGFLACFAALSGRYLAAVAWEPAPALEARAARLLPGLMLGRVDGKSPVEYLTTEDEKDKVRRVARRFLAEPASTLAAIAGAWRKELRG